MNNSTVEVYILETKTDILSLIDKVPYLDRKSIFAILKRIDFPVTVVHEKYYVDRVYRDSFYSYYSNKHFYMQKNCQRLSLFSGLYSYNDFLFCKNKKSIEDNFIGVMIVRPTPIEYGNCTMGRTLINPYKIKLNECYVRTTEFFVSILGKEYKFEAFPFSGQDGEIMTCTETCVWEILEYFGSRYSNYRTILPSDIISNLKTSSQERILPSRGLTFLQVSDLLKSFGFEPRLYYKKSYEGNEKDIEKGLKANKKCDKINTFRKIFHYYVESAVPFAVGISNSVNEGHCIVCIGHGLPKYNLLNVDIHKVGNLRIIDSASFYNEYVIMDDNQTPYQIETFDHFSYKQSMEVQFMAVPLYKHIFLEANGAMIIVNKLINNIASHIEKILKELLLIKNTVEPIITRLYITSSRNFKSFRINNARSLEEKLFYSDMNFPKFLWVCELSTYFTYTNEKMAVGEILLDATASDESSFDSIIALRIGQYIGYRAPNDDSKHILDEFNFKENFLKKYPIYKNNLKKGGLKTS